MPHSSIYIRLNRLHFLGEVQDFMIMSMASQPPSSTTTPSSSAKQARSRKAVGTDSPIAGRAGSAGGVVLENEVTKRTSPSTTPKTTSSQSKDAPPKRKPRKLNKEPTSTCTTPIPSTKIEPAAELEALKSRVRGLEAKVDDLYKSTQTVNVAPRSPRRRGKGRKNSSANTTVTLGNLAQTKQEQQAQSTHIDDEEEEEADEELDRLESELEVARQDLAHYRPRTRRSVSEDTEYIEEIPRGTPGVSVSTDRQVTLSGSYRIPLPANLNPEDVKTIQSGVSAAQNVARSFLDQRRANQASRNAQVETPPNPQATKPKSSHKAKEQEPGSGSSPDFGAQQSWGEWIGGYSMAITRAIKTIEHEAAMEAQKPSQGRATNSSTSGGRASAGGTKKKGRPAAKTSLSGEQVQGLMS